MAEPAGNIIALPVRIYPIDIFRFSDFVNFKSDRLRKFFLKIILHAVGYGNSVAFQIDKNVRILTVTLFYVEVEDLTEFNQRDGVSFLSYDKQSYAVRYAPVFTDLPVIIDYGIGHALITVVFLLVLFGSLCYQDTFKVIEPAAKANHLLLMVKFHFKLLAFVFRHCCGIRI